MSTTWVADGSGTPTFERTAHLVALVATCERLATRLRTSTPPPERTEELVARAALASLRLDGSPVTTPPDLDEALPDGPAAPSAFGRPRERTTGTWLDAMGLAEQPDQEIMAREYRGMRAALAADDLAGRILVEPRVTFAELHRRLTRGLVDEGAAGRPRRTRQAVQDVSVGRVIFHAAAPEQVPTRLAGLAGWMVSAGTREHALVVSGVVHHELLATHPYEAANGRLARTAARLVLRARGLDPHGVAPIEAVLAQDALGYYSEVAKTLRRRDLTIWLERWGEAVSGGLRAAARHLGLLDTRPSPRVESFLAGWDEPAFTIADYRAHASVGPEEARSDLGTALDAGRVRRVPGARGLRFLTVVGDDADNDGGV